MIGQIVNLLPAQYSPIQINGHGNQVAYLSQIPRPFAATLIALAEPALNFLLEDHSRLHDEKLQWTSTPDVLFEWEEKIQGRIRESLDIPETTRKALIDARRGQGRFRQGVQRLERECRITRVRNNTHLVASHIKPWREGSDEERLSGANGLMLTPSIDHLFDRGVISFGDSGEVLLSPVADHESLPRMGVEVSTPIITGQFNSDQKHFLSYHRDNIFLKSAL
ncbi:MAG: HNH endonuclease [Terrimicrobiaceae bacterium]